MLRRAQSGWDWVTSSGRARWLVPLVVVATAVATMVVRVGHPERIFFDEVYYVNDARDFLEYGVEDGFVVHPPLGKLLIAVGIHLVGDTPMGWRIVGGLLAVAAVWLTYLLGRRLGLRLAAAGLAGLALALDGVFIAQARIGMLDIHLGFFVVLGAYALVRDRDRLRAADDEALRAANREQVRARRARTPVAAGIGVPPHEADAPAEPEPTATSIDPVLPHPPLEGEPSTVATGPDAPVADGLPDVLPDGPVTTIDGEPVHAPLPRVGRWWLVVAGIAFGAATGTKWTGAVALIVAGLVWLGIELARRRRVTGRFGPRLGRGILLGVVVLGLLPIAVYATTWIPWYAAFDQTWIATTHCGDAGDELDCDGVVGETRALISYHERMFTFHDELEAEHTYRAPAWGWPIQLRPVVYYYETCSDNRLDRVEQTDSDGEVTTPEPCRVAQDQAGEILSLGNPAVWWLALALLPILGMLARRRDRQVWVPMTFYAVQFLFWVAVLPLVSLLTEGNTVSRPIFNFYTVPFVPFLVLLLALAVDRVTSRDGWIRASVGGLVLGGLALAATFVPELIGERMLTPARWYVVALSAMLGGALAGVQPAASWFAREPATARPDRRWPTLAVVGVVVAVGLFFLPVWTGVTLPEEFVKAHWWLRTWI